LKRVWSSWLLWRQLCIRNKLLVVHSTNFRSQKLKGCWFGVWKQQLAILRHQRCKERQALWFWSQQLERKVISSWLHYSATQQEIKERSRRSLALRYHAFLKRAVVCWVEVWHLLG
jgi:hypothetical protein